MDLVYQKVVGPDGATYIGTTRNGLPSGLGTCVWPNHSQYDGEWREGTMHGFGTYVYRGGQRYDGEWKDGKRDGIGIKTYADGSMYDGFWKNDKKHGLGVFRPAPDDPSSRRHSQGWPSQPSPNQASAAAAASLSHSGTGLSSSGIDSPVPAADAADSAPPSPQQQQQQPQQQEGASPQPSPHAEIPQTSLEHPGALDPAAAGLESLRLRLSLHPVPSSGSIAPSEHVTLAANDKGATGTSAAQPGGSGSAAAGSTAPRVLFVREYDQGKLLRQDTLSAEEIRKIFGSFWAKNPNKVWRPVQRVLGRAPRLQVKLGQQLYKGHYSWELMVALQLGIRHSVGRPENLPQPQSHSIIKALAQKAKRQQQQQQATGRGSSSSRRPPSPADFKAAVKKNFPNCGRSIPDGPAPAASPSAASPHLPDPSTPAHTTLDFKWKDYSPDVFKRLRELFGVDSADYIMSLAGSQALRQLNSPGKSGSMFFLSEDQRYLVKTMRKSEMKVLLEMLPKYFDHVTQCPQTLITRFFGLHRVTPLHGRSVRFVVMANIFVTDLLIHRRYDIKGSTEGRTVGPLKKVEGDPNVILKDLDVDMKLQLDTPSYTLLMNQLQADCALLREVGVMDYSLLLGVHYPSKAAAAAAAAREQGMASDGGAAQDSDSAAAAAAYHRGLSLRTITTSDDESQSEGPGGAFRFTVAAPAPVALGSAVAAGAAEQQQQQQGTVSLEAQMSATLALTSAVGGNCSSEGAGGGSPTHAAAAAAGPLKQQLSGNGHGPLQLTGPLESLPETGELLPAAGGSGAIAVPSFAAQSAAAAAAGGGQRLERVPTLDLRPTRGTADGEPGPGVVAGGARNWDVYTGQAELEERLEKIVQRMRKMNFSEQRMKDIAELARLKILGSKLKKSAVRKEPPSAVLQAIQQQRHQEHQSGGGAATAASTSGAGSAAAAGAAAGGALLGSSMGGSLDGSLGASRELLPMGRNLVHLQSLRGAFTGLQTEDEDDDGVAETPMAGNGLEPARSATAAPQLGINMLALAVPNGAPDKVEEVVVCFGIIDILQDYSTRKVLERGIKTLTHDGDAVSVAPPKRYAGRFLNFIKQHLFAAPPGWVSDLGEVPSSPSAQTAGGRVPAAAAGLPAQHADSGNRSTPLRLLSGTEYVGGAAAAEGQQAAAAKPAATAAARGALPANGHLWQAASCGSNASGTPTSQEAVPIAVVLPPVGSGAKEGATAHVPAAAAGAAQ